MNSDFTQCCCLLLFSYYLFTVALIDFILFYFFLSYYSRRGTGLKFGIHRDMDQQLDLRVHFPFPFASPNSATADVIETRAAEPTMVTLLLSSNQG